jgi:hypothetical protein
MPSPARSYGQEKVYISTYLSAGQKQTDTEISGLKTQYIKDAATLTNDSPAATLLALIGALFSTNVSYTQ